MRNNSLENKHIKRVLDYAKKERNAANKEQYNYSNPQEHSVQILPDTKVEPALFIPSKLTTKVYYAHPDTIRALKKNIFCLGNEIDELCEIEPCPSCNKNLDLQFWHSCPHCGKSLSQ